MLDYLKYEGDSHYDVSSKLKSFLKVPPQVKSSAAQLPSHVLERTLGNWPHHTSMDATCGPAT